MTDEEDLNAQRARIMELCHEYRIKLVVKGCESSGRIKTHDPAQSAGGTPIYVVLLRIRIRS